MKRLLGLLLLFNAYAVSAQPTFPPLQLQEEDGAPAGTAIKIRVTNGTLTDNGSGDFSIATGGGGGGGGDSVSIDSVAVTDPDFVSTGDIDFVDTANTVTANINAGAIVNADINASAAIDVSKTALVAGTNISLSTNTLNVDDAFLLNTGDTSTGDLSISKATSPKLSVLETGSNVNTVVQSTTTEGQVGTTSNHNLELLHNNKTVALFNDDQIFFTASDLIIEPDGSSVIGSVGRVLMMEGPGLGRHVVGFKAPASIAANKIWELPGVDGSSGQYLKTNGSEVLSWGTDSDNQSLFQTISTTSGTSPVADSATDTLTLTAGSGITVTGDSSTDTITIAATGGGGGSNSEDYFRHVGTTDLERWYPGRMITGQASLTSRVSTSNMIAAIPFIEPRGGTLDRIGVYVTSAGTTGQNARLGIYQATSGTNVYPGSLVLDAGEIALDSTGLKSITISQALSANTLYYLVINVESAASPAQLKAIGGSSMFFGVDSSFSAPGNLLEGTSTYGALPSTFPSGVGTVTFNSWLIAVRYSA